MLTKQSWDEAFNSSQLRTGADVPTPSRCHRRHFRAKSVYPALRCSTMEGLCTVPKITVALPTPFDEDQVDVPGLERMAGWVKEQGVNSVIAAGTTGEFAGMTFAERVLVLEATRRGLGVDGFLFANVSACCVDDAVQLARDAVRSNARPDALLLLPPFYHAPFSPAINAAGVEAFFRKFFNRLPRRFEADCAPGAERRVPPVFLYTFAWHTQQPISAEVYGRLCAEFPDRIAGVKASGMGLEQAQQFSLAAPGRAVLVGNGRINLDVLKAGLHVVSGDGVPVCWALSKLLRLVEANELGRAAAVQQALIRAWRGCVDKYDEIAADKAAFAKILRVSTKFETRPPLVPLAEAEAVDIQQAVEKLFAEVQAA